MTGEILDGELAVAEALDADLTGVSVGLKHPSSTGAAWVLVTQLDASTVGSSQPDRIIDFMLQVDCYAGSDNERVEASTVTRRARAALKALSGTSRNGAVFGRVRILSAPRVPDEAVSDPPRERYAMTVSVIARAV